MKKTTTSVVIFVLCLFSCVGRAQIITTIIGNGSFAYSGDGGPATVASIYGVGAIAKDKAGNIYISDPQKNVVRKISPAGIITVFAGTVGSTVIFGGDGGTATAAKLNSPIGLAIDKDDNVYIGDAENYRIRKVNTAGIITTYAGKSPYISGDGGPATAANIIGGHSLCFDKAGNLYISGPSRVRKITPEGIISTYAGNSTAYYEGDGVVATATGYLYLAKLATDDVGNLYLSCTNTIRKVSPAGIMTTVAGNDSFGYSGDGGPATAAKLQYPAAVYPDGCNNFYLSDGNNNCLRKVDAHGIITTVAGNGIPGYSGNGGPATAARLNQPAALYIDDKSNIYLYDGLNSVIRYIKMDSCKNVLASPSFDKGSGQAEVRLYPNPNTGVFTLRIASGITTEAVVTITDMMGRVVKQLTTTTNKDTEVGLHVPPGVYVVQVVTADERYVQRVMVE